MYTSERIDRKGNLVAIGRISAELSPSIKKQKARAKPEAIPEPETEENSAGEKPEKESVRQEKIPKKNDNSTQTKEKEHAVKDGGVDQDEKPEKESSRQEKIQKKNDHSTQKKEKENAVKHSDVDQDEKPAKESSRQEKMPKKNDHSTQKKEKESAVKDDGDDQDEKPEKESIKQEKMPKKNDHSTQKKEKENAVKDGGDDQEEKPAKESSRQEKMPKKNENSTQKKEKENAVKHSDVDQDEKPAKGSSRQEKMPKKNDHSTQKKEKENAVKDDGDGPREKARDEEKAKPSKQLQINGQKQQLLTSPTTSRNEERKNKLSQSPSMKKSTKTPDGKTTGKSNETSKKHNNSTTGTEDKIDGTEERKNEELEEMSSESEVPKPKKSNQEPSRSQSTPPTKGHSRASEKHLVKSMENFDNRRVSLPPLVTSDQNSKQTKAWKSPRKASYASVLTPGASMTSGAPCRLHPQVLATHYCFPCHVLCCGDCALRSKHRGGNSTDGNNQRNAGNATGIKRTTAGAPLSPSPSQSQSHHHHKHVPDLESAYRYVSASSNHALSILHDRRTETTRKYAKLAARITDHHKLTTDEISWAAQEAINTIKQWERSSINFLDRTKATTIADLYTTQKNTTAEIDSLFRKYTALEEKSQMGDVTALHTYDEKSHRDEIQDVGSAVTNMDNIAENFVAKSALTKLTTTKLYGPNI